jgi:hypothetical protein
MAVVAETFVEMDIDAPVAGAFLLDFAKTYPPDFQGARHRGAIAGLQVNLIVTPVNSHQTNMPGPTRRLNRHCFDEPRIGIKFCVRDPTFRHLKIARIKGV